MYAKCIGCGHTANLGDRALGKLGGALAGSVLGASASRRFAGFMIGAAVGGVIGHWLDRNVLPDCPECGGILCAVDEVVLAS